MMARMAQNYKTPDLQAAALADAAKDLTVGTNGITGDLTEDGAKALLSFGGARGVATRRPSPTPRVR